MTSISFYGGIGEVGGNKILIEDEEARIFLDFGKSFAKERKFYDEPYIRPKKEKHLLKLGLLPQMDGLYKDEEEPPVDAVLISHPHLDHWGYVYFLDNGIPIHCGEATKEIVTSYEFCSRAAPSADYCIAKMTKEEGKTVLKDFETFRTGDTVPLNSMEIDPVHVDHSIPGSYGFIIHTSAGSIAYTGDLRLHGPRGDLTEDFLKRAESTDLKIFICEATNITGATSSSEDEVEGKLRNLIEPARGLVVACFSSRDVDRLRSFYKSAKKNGRKLAVSMKQAFLLKALARDPHLDIFGLQDPNILVFRKEKKREDAWEDEVLMDKDIHYASDLHGIQDQVVLVASLYDMNELMEVAPLPGSIFILSQSEPFDEEGEIRHEKLLNWCKHYGMPQYHVHASGHIMPQELKSAIKRLDPQTVIPVHTEAPLQFRRFISDLKYDVKLPEVGKEISV